MTKGLMSLALINLKQKCITTAEATWQHTQKPQGSNPKHARLKHNLVFYCKYCKNPLYSTYISTTFCNYLLKIHLIKAASSDLNLIKKACKNLLKEAFNKASKIKVIRL